MNPPERFVFDRFTVDTRAREVRCGDVPVPVGGRLFDLLTALASRAGALVTKETLLAEVWAGTPVEENTLAQAISSLRRILRDAGATGAIVTVAGKGYQFVLPAPTSNRARFRLFAAIAAAAVLAAAITASRLLPLHRLHIGEEHCLAVLPFQALDGAAVSGIAVADALIGRLATEKGLRVRPTSSIAGLPTASLRDLGAALKVDRIVTGTLRRTNGHTLRVQIELIDVNKEAAVWTAAFDEAGSDAPTDALIATIAGVIRPRVM